MMNARLAITSGLMGLLLTISFPLLGAVPIVGPQFAYDFYGEELYREEINCEQEAEGDVAQAYEVDGSQDEQKCYYLLQNVGIGWPLTVVRQKLGPDFDSDQLPTLGYPEYDSLPDGWIVSDWKPLGIIGNIIILSAVSAPIAYLLLKRRGLL